MLIVANRNKAALEAKNSFLKSMDITREGHPSLPPFPGSPKSASNEQRGEIKSPASGDRARKQKGIKKHEKQRASLHSGVDRFFG